MIERRPASQVMRLSRLGSLHQSRLSFMRQLTRRMARENWRFERQCFDIDATGVGTAVLTAHAPEHSYSLVAFAHDLPDEMRSDRVIATAWDATFTLYDGIPTEADIARLAKNVPLQEAGRISEQELTLSRANRSARLWNTVIDALAKGAQPNTDDIENVGYLMRTTAVYGSGKFGAADRETYAAREELASPFQAELLTVYLIRWFVRDLLNHMAQAKGGDAACDIAPDIAQRLGIGNSTGLGMAPFLINHPALFNFWIMAREEAIARVRSVQGATEDTRVLFASLVQKSDVTINTWRSDHPLQCAKIADLKGDIKALKDQLQTGILDQDTPWDALYRWGEATLSEEGQELVASLILEPYPDLVDGLTSCMSDDGPKPVLDGAISIGDTIKQLTKVFDWAQDIDWSTKEATARSWYVSEEKLEPRLGERYEEPIARYEQPLAPARDAMMALKDLNTWDKATPVAQFLTAHPEHRHIIKRAQLIDFAPYSEIRDNTIAADLMPIDMLRAKLSFFGATHFDPRSDRWVRICMYAGAPYPQELTTANADLWVYPEAGT